MRENRPCLDVSVRGLKLETFYYCYYSFEKCLQGNRSIIGYFSTLGSVGAWLSGERRGGLNWLSFGAAGFSQREEDTHPQMCQLLWPNHGL